MESLLVTDSRGLYDSAASSESPLLGMANSRTGVEVAAIQKALRDDGRCYLTWVPSDINLADSLTKATVDAFRLLPPTWKGRLGWFALTTTLSAPGNNKGCARRKSCKRLLPQRPRAHLSGTAMWRSFSSLLCHSFASRAKLERKFCGCSMRFRRCFFRRHRRRSLAFHRGPYGSNRGAPLS